MLSLPASGFEDEFGRVLPQAIEMKFSTNHRNPNFEMPHKYAVLESQTDSELPFYVNNLESFTFNYRSVTPDGVKENQTYSKSVQKSRISSTGFRAVCARCWAGNPALSMGFSRRILRLPINGKATANCSRR